MTGMSKQLYMVYMLADQRVGPYVIGVGGLLDEVMREVKDVHFKRTCAAGDPNLFPFCLVWLERMDTLSAALERAAEIQKWPHRWQRRLVESSNPEWWEWSQTESDYPRSFWQSIPETLVARRR